MMLIVVLVVVWALASTWIVLALCQAAGTSDRESDRAVRSESQRHGA